jgi:excisionase family DNA binding protein
MKKAKPRSHGALAPAGTSKGSPDGAVQNSNPDFSRCPPAICLLDPSLPTLLSVDATAIELSVSTKTVRRLITSGALPSCRVGRLVRIRAVDLAEFVASGTGV